MNNLKTKPWNNAEKIALAAILIFVALIRLRLLDYPFERDEGEYAYFGQLILEGIPPYKMAYHMKLPGTYFMYAFFMGIFGQTVRGAHIGLLIVNLCSILFLFSLVKKILGGFAALVAAGTLGILSVNVGVIGNAGHATHFVTMFALAGILLLYKAEKNGKKTLYFWSGVLLALSPIMKQSGIFFSFFGTSYIILNYILFNRKDFKKKILEFLIFAIGGVTPLVILLALIKFWGVYDTFVFWVIDYAGTYKNHATASEFLSSLVNNFSLAFNAFFLVGVFAVIGLLLIFSHPRLKKANDRLFILLFVFFSFLNTCPLFIIREHYVVAFLPVTALLFSIAIDYINLLRPARVLKKISIGIAVLSLLIGVWAQRFYFFFVSPQELCRVIVGQGFDKSMKIAEFIEENSGEDDAIAVFGSEAQICFYAHRHSATGYVQTYSLTENQPYALKMQQQMLQEIAETNPKFFVIVNNEMSWLPDYHFDELTRAANKYIKDNHYKVVASIGLTDENVHQEWTKPADSSINVQYENIVILGK